MIFKIFSKVFVLSVSLLLFVVNSFAADYEVHVISVYEGPSAGPGSEIFVAATAKPVILVLSSYSRTGWYITLKKGANLQRVIVNGHEPQYVYISDKDGSPSLVVPEYFTYEAICHAGESRDVNSPGSFEVYPTKKSSSAKTKFLENLSSMAGVDVSNVEFNTRYTAKYNYSIGE